MDEELGTFKDWLSTSLRAVRDHSTVDVYIYILFLYIPSFFFMFFNFCFYIYIFIYIYIVGLLGVVIHTDILMIDAIYRDI